MLNEVTKMTYNVSFQVWWVYFWLHKNIDTTMHCFYINNLHKSVVLCEYTLHQLVALNKYNLILAAGKTYIMYENKQE